MRNSKRFLMLLLIPVVLNAQIEQEEVTVINIVVPLRVFDGDRFVANLTLNDLELFEDGVPQKVQSLFLVNGNSVAKAEAPLSQRPILARNFYLLFQLTEYNPQISDAINFFFNDVFLENDTVTMMTPHNVYALSKAAIRAKTKNTLAKDTITLIVNDTQVGAADYNSQLNDLKRLVSAISATTQTGDQRITSGLESDQTLLASGGIQFLLPRIRDTLQRMEELRIVDERKILKFSTQLKRQFGRKYVFFFYQREYRPELHPNAMNKLMTEYQDDANIRGQMQDMFNYYRRDISLNTERLQQSFADSDILFNFIFLNKQPENVSGILMREQSEDMFRIFSDVASATGGITDSSQNPATAFRNAVAVADNYYLLYYSPANYKPDGKFHRIVVMVKGKNYRITHRKGYLAN